MTYRRLSAKFAREFWSDSDGVVLPYVAIMLGVIIGLSALALDGSRLMSVQTQLQNGADALALAGAAELDRRPDSIIRARAAIQDLIKNPISGAEIGQTAEVTSIDFLQSLPASDDLPITTANLTDDPTLAAYVQVSLKPIAMQMIFPISAAPRMTVGAQAIAGYDQIVCNARPVFVCNPFENSGMTYFQATQALIQADQDSTYHPLIRLALSQKNGGYSAGDTGYLIPATGALPANACGPGGEYGLPQALASTELQACFRISGINLMQGDKQPAADGLNTRFDIYANGFRSCRAAYPPDQNVRKGFIALGNINWCNAIPVPANWPLPNPVATPLPVDSNMIAADQSFNPAVNVGNGTWNCAAYWSIAHSIGPGKNSPPAGCTTTATISRYDVYRYELNFPSDRSTGAEFGRPQCNPPGAANRRVLTVPIVNCGSSPVPVLNNAQRVPVAAFGRFFLALPAETGTSGNPYAEFLGLVKRTDPLSTDMVQLNR